MITAMPCSARLLIRFRTKAVCETPSAAVGSSMITSRASSMTALATATACRCPPDSEPTGWRMLWTVVTCRSWSVRPAVFSIVISSSRPCLRTSWPSSMFCTMSRLSHRARSWYTVAIPALAASRGLWKCTGLPCQTISPSDGSQIPAIVLISVVLPAPLSPTRAVTCPAGMSRSTPASACTGPNVLLMPRSLSSVSPASAGDVRPAGTRRTSLPPPGTCLPFTSTPHQGPPVREKAITIRVIARSVVSSGPWVPGASGATGSGSGS